MTEIKDYKNYTGEMFKSAYDKLWFVDKIFEPIDYIVDFGCADGAVTRIIKLFYPDSVVIGYDLPNVIARNNERTDETVIYTADLDEIKEKIKDKKSILVLNSVVHEIYNYEKNPTEFLKKLFDLGFTFIWIRDLCITENDIVLDPYFKSTLDRIKTEYKDQVEDFEKIYGPVEYQKNFIHFLLKYKYITNWDREVRENYTLFGEKLTEVQKLLDNNYNTIIEETYVLPYHQYTFFMEFGIDLEEGLCNTHFRGLYRREEN